MIARDATEVEAREKPAKETNDKYDDPPPPDSAQPPHKDEDRPKPEPTRLERQTTQNLGQMLAELPIACNVGCKKNSKGYKETWNGYKLHLDVACGQILVSCVLTSASVHGRSPFTWMGLGSRALKLMHMPDTDDVIFDFRTIAERINARLEDEFGRAHVDQILRVIYFGPALT